MRAWFRSRRLDHSGLGAPACACVAETKCWRPRVMAAKSFASRLRDSRRFLNGFLAGAVVGAAGAGLTALQFFRRPDAESAKLARQPHGESASLSRLGSPLLPQILHLAAGSHVTTPPSLAPPRAETLFVLHLRCSTVPGTELAFSKCLSFFSCCCDNVYLTEAT